MIKLVAVFAFLFAFAGSSRAEDVKTLSTIDLHPYLVQPAYAEAEQAKAIFEKLGGTRYILYTPGVGGFSSVSVKFGEGICCLNAFHESDSTYRCFQVKAGLQLP